VTKLPRGMSGQEVVKALNRIGFYTKRQKGSHIVLRRDNPFAQVVVPDHKNLDTGTLASILDGADLSTEEFIQLIK
jgi:predicted RNA binding protein YcfA (HicA-like mRNA interferase family)